MAALLVVVAMDMVVPVAIVILSAQVFVLAAVAGLETLLA
jgi:hypothetical protein